jgi:hypothetical protein
MRVPSVHQPNSWKLAAIEDPGQVLRTDERRSRQLLPLGPNRVGMGFSQQLGLRLCELPVRPILPHLHQELKLAQLDLLFEETEAGLLPHIERLVDGLAGLQKISGRTGFDFLQRPQTIANVVVLGSLSAALRRARIGHPVQFLKQPEPLHFVSPARLLKRPEFRQELCELRVVEPEKFLPLNHRVAVEKLLHFTRR